MPCHSVLCSNKTLIKTYILTPTFVHPFAQNSLGIFQRYVYEWYTEVKIFSTRWQNSSQASMNLYYYYHHHNYDHHYYCYSYITSITKWKPLAQCQGLNDVVWNRSFLPDSDIVFYTIAFIFQTAYYNTKGPMNVTFKMCEISKNFFCCPPVQ